MAKAQSRVRRGGREALGNKSVGSGCISNAASMSPLDGYDFLSPPLPLPALADVSFEQRCETRQGSAD